MCLNVTFLTPAGHTSATHTALWRGSDFQEGFPPE